MNFKVKRDAPYSQQPSIKDLLKDQRIVLIMVLIVMAIVVANINSRFIGINNIVLIFQQISIVGVLTIAMAITMLGGGVDLSIGNVMVLVGCTMAVLIEGNSETGFAGLPVWIAIVIGTLIGLVCGILNGVIVSKSKCAPLVITLGLSSVYYGIALIITQGRVMSFSMTFEPIRLLRIGGPIPITLIWFLILVILTYLIINKTKFGRRLVLWVETRKMPGYAVYVDRYKIAMYSISGLYCYSSNYICITSDAISAASGTDMKLLHYWSYYRWCYLDGGRGTISGAFLEPVYGRAESMNVLAINPFIQTVVSELISAVAISNYEQICKGFNTIYKSILTRCIL